ncbi:peptide transporter PTR2A [Mycena maculata]|uniref:Peptide transporter PTR2A n=1 Tax=Mycena maculata TaxID=230809 RepID=A0AAD7HTY5_9AGAR|nr:peptide transporter PTR2A [Mycena maculata]
MAGLQADTTAPLAALSEERATLRRVPYHVPWNAYLIAIVELAERFSTNFIQQPLPPGSHTGAGFGILGVSGALGMGQRASTGLTTFYQFINFGVCYATPLLGAYIADTYCGRYNTTCVAVHKSAVGAFIVALRVMGFGRSGAGLFKANISPLVAEQYKRTELFVRTTRSGEKVLVDPSLTISRVYMVPLVGQIRMTYSERVSSGHFCFCWNPRPVRAAVPGFWDDTKPSAVERHQWVDEARRGLRLTYGQLNNNLTSQAPTMVTGKVPPDVLSNLDPFALIIFIPICDLLVYPALRRWSINFTQLKKITAGFTNRCSEHASTCFDANGVQIPSPLNVWIQTCSSILASITGLEYAFTKAPKNMRSFVMSVFLFMDAISSPLAEAFVSLSADPLLVWNYGVMAALAATTSVLVWWSVRNLDAKEDELNNLAEEHVEAK